VAIELAAVSTTACPGSFNATAQLAALRLNFARERGRDVSSFSIAFTPLWMNAASELPIKEDRMKTFHGIARSACFAVAALALVGTPVQAQSAAPRFGETLTVPGDLRSPTPDEYLVAFSGPFGLPGVGLPGGMYLFRVLSPHILQVLSADRVHIYAMFTTIATTRDDRSMKDVVFGAGVLGAPRPITAWFPPGSRAGHELIYRNTNPKRSDTN
jgi:hypothetical protein